MLDVTVNGKITRRQLPRALFTPDVTTNLVSVSVLTRRQGARCVLTSDGAMIEKDGRTIMTASHRGPSILLDAKAVPAPLHVAFAAVAAPLETWHHRLKHLSLDAIRKMASSAANDVQFAATTACGDVCEACQLGKMHRLPFPMSSRQSKRIFDLVHSDVVDPVKPETGSGKRYIVTFIDDYSRKAWPSPFRKKSETFEAFKSFRILAEKQSGRSIKALQSDNVGECTSTAFETYLKRAGTQRRLTVP